MTEFKHELGKVGRDIITGFEGIIIGRAEHLTGCNQYGIAPKTLKDGVRIQTEWFDEGRIEIVGEGITAEAVAAATPGCDYRDHP